MFKLDDLHGLVFPVWDPHANAEGSFHVMPILTPVFPQQNSTFNVSRSTLEVIKEEFRLSRTVCVEITNGKATWDKLFEAPNFFSKYKHYIVVKASSSTDDDQIQWHGHVKSKIRHLVCNLEQESLQLAHVWPNSYPGLEEGKEKQISYWMIGLLLMAKRKRKKGEKQLAKNCSPLIQPECRYNSTMSSDSMTETSGQLPNGLQTTLLPHVEDVALPSAQIIRYLKTPIDVFCELVMRSAVDIKMWQDGMQVEAYYHKRKQLKQYLSPEERYKLKPEKKRMVSFATNPRPGANSMKTNPKH